MSEHFVYAEFEKELESLPIEQRRRRVEDVLQELTSDLNRIKSQIEANRVNPANPHYADRDWWLRLNGARRVKAAQIQSVNRLLGRLPKNRPHNPERPAAFYFVDVVREHLSEEEFKGLMAEAIRRKQQQDDAALENSKYV